MVFRADRPYKEHVGLFNVSRVTFSADVAVNDIAVHLVHCTILLSRGTSDEEQL